VKEHHLYIIAEREIKGSCYLLFIFYEKPWYKEFKDTKGVIRIHKSKNRRHNDQKKKYKARSTKHTHKTKDRITQTPLKPGVNLCAPEA
jgi:hypothetical protein